MKSTTSTCPSCGGASRSHKPCNRCKTRGFVALQLDLGVDHGSDNPAVRTQDKTT